MKIDVSAFKNPPRPTSADSIHGLEKGLEVLAYLNRRTETSVADVARGLDLPRTTALRVLETLRRAGYIDRGGKSKTYRLTIQVRSLSDGYDDEQWVSDIARPAVQDLARQVVWPILVATPAGSSMLWRANTDRESPLALTRYAHGMRVPTVDSASGHVYLAFCSHEERQAILDLYAMYPDAQNWIGFEALERRLEQVRERGYAIVQRRHHHECGLAVPIRAGERYLASLAMRYMYGVMPEDKLLEQFLEPLQETAARIGADFEAKVKNSQQRRG